MHSGHRGMRQVSEYELLGTVPTEIGYELLAMIKTFCFHLFLTEIVLFNNKKMILLIVSNIQNLRIKLNSFIQILFSFCQLYNIHHSFVSLRKNNFQVCPEARVLCHFFQNR